MSRRCFPRWTLLLTLVLVLAACSKPRRAARSALATMTAPPITTTSPPSAPARAPSCRTPVAGRSTPAWAPCAGRRGCSARPTNPENLFYAVNGFVHC